MSEARKMAKQIASMPPAAVQRSKQVLRHGMQSTLDQVIQHETMVFLDCIKTEEHRLGLRKLLAEMKSRNIGTIERGNSTREQRCLKSNFMRTHN
jgi:enoyl-CoA hydratase/carnithine racemase